jgi:hypothetical protein
MNLILTEEQEDKALLIAIEEGMKSRTLSEQEATDFINSLGK